MAVVSADTRRKASLLARTSVFLLGVAAIVGALLIWLIPTHSTTTVTETSKTSTADSATHGSKTTTGTKTTTTRAPGAGRSDTVLVALLTFGFGLVLVAGAWNRIQELTIGGVTVKLADAAADTVADIDAADMAAANVQAVDSGPSDAVAKEVNAIAKSGVELVRIDIRAGDLWATLNLSLFVLLLARRTSVRELMFSGQGPAGRETYLGACWVRLFADRLLADNPSLAAAMQATETLPLPEPQESTALLGQQFVSTALETDPVRQQDAREIVDVARLRALAGEQVLVTASVEAAGTTTLSREEQRAVLSFPLPYVPVTDRGHLAQILDKQRLVERIAGAAVGSS